MPADANSRFWDKVEKTRTCWLWKGSISTQGYGQFWLYGKIQAAHRVAWHFSGREIPDGRVLDHRCRSRNCVRAEHLEVVSQRENLMRGIGATATNARKVACVHGHPYTSENTVFNKNGTRRCRTCKRGYDQKRQEKTNAMR